MKKTTEINDLSKGIFTLPLTTHRRMLQLLADKDLAKLRATCRYMDDTYSKLLYTRDRLRIQTIKTNGKTSFAIVRDNGLFITGRNIFSEKDYSSCIGNKADQITEFTPVSGIEGTIQDIKLFTKSVFVITTDGVLFAGGQNSYGNLGLGEDRNMNNQFTPVIGIDGKVKDVYAHNHKTFALTVDGQLYACGANVFSGLGLGDKEQKIKCTFTPVTGLKEVTIKTIVLCPTNSYVLTEDGNLYWCGDGIFQEQATNDVKPSSQFIKFSWDKGAINDIKFNPYRAFILTKTGEVYALGSNPYGELGVGDKKSRNAFTPVVGIDGFVVDVQMGFGKTFALTDDGKVYACGKNSLFGDLGVGDSELKSQFTAVVGLEDVNVMAVRVRKNAVYALTDNGQVFSAGMNKYGWKGNTKTSCRFTRVLEITEKTKSLASSDDCIFALSQNSNLYAFGEGRDGQLGLDKKRFNIKFQPVTLCDEKKPFSAMTKFWHNRAPIVARTCAKEIANDADIDQSIDHLICYWHSIKPQNDSLLMIIQAISHRIEKGYEMPESMNDLLECYDISWLFLQEDNVDSLFCNDIAKGYLNFVDEQDKKKILDDTLLDNYRQSLVDKNCPLHLYGI